MTLSLMARMEKLEGAAGKPERYVATSSPPTPDQSATIERLEVEGFRVTILHDLFSPRPT